MNAIKLNCVNCNKEFEKYKGEYNSQIKAGTTNFFCCLNCSVSFQMKQKGKSGIPPTGRLPVLLRPAQLPFRDSAVLNAMTALDASTLQSALTTHWDWIHQVIERFLPDHYALYAVSVLPSRAGARLPIVSAEARSYLLADGREPGAPSLRAAVIGDPLAYHIRPGPHDITPVDWAHYLDFADQHLRKKIAQP